MWDLSVSVSFSNIQSKKYDQAEEMSLQISPALLSYLNKGGWGQFLIWCFGHHWWLCRCTGVTFQANRGMEASGGCWSWELRCKVIFLMSSQPWFWLTLSFSGISYCTPKRPPISMIRNTFLWLNFVVFKNLGISNLPERTTHQSS